MNRKEITRAPRGHSTKPVGGMRIKRIARPRAAADVKNGSTKPFAAVVAPRGAVERSLRVLEVLTEAAGPASLASVAQATGLETNTVHRLMERLVGAGYVRKSGATKRYSIGARALFPMSLHHPLNRLRLESREQLRLLRERHDQSVCLIVFVGTQRVIVDFLPGREPLSPLYETWLSNPLHASAAGIILLASLPEDERRRLLGDEPFFSPTTNTLTTYAGLAKEIDALESNGYAVARQTTFVGVNAVAAPIRGPQRAIGCLAFTGSSYALDESQLAALGESLRDAANLISLGAPSIKALTDFLGDSVPDTESPSTVRGRG